MKKLLFALAALIPWFVSHAAEKQGGAQGSALPRPAWLKGLADQGTRDARLEGYKTPAGFKVEIVAAAPLLANPQSMTFGGGELYVVEWAPAAEARLQEGQITFTYKDGSSRKVASLKKATKDRVKVLPAPDGAAAFAEARVVLEDEFPSCILVHDGWMYLGCPGTVRRWRLKDLETAGGGKPELVAHGFAGLPHSQASGLSIGNDGWLYISCGAADNVVEGADGSRATVLRSGAVFRCRPDGTKLHAFAQGFCAPRGDGAWDAGFHLFHADRGSADLSKFSASRVLHVAEGVDFGWRLRAKALNLVPDYVRGAAFGDLPGRMKPLARLDRQVTPCGAPQATAGAAGGTLIYNETGFPEDYRGLLYVAEPQRIKAFKLQAQGASFEAVEAFDFLTTKDPHFQPCQLTVGPDGALYVCDRAGGGSGRLLRITWAGTADQPAIARRRLDSWARLGKLPEKELLEALEGASFSDRLKAQQELVRRGAEMRAALLQWVANGDRSLRARLAALGALQGLWNDEVQKACLGLLRDMEPDLRRLAVDGLALNVARGDKETHDALVQELNDEHPAVRRAIFLALGKIDGPGAADDLINTLQFDESKDAYLRDGLVRGLEALGKTGIDKLLSLSDSGGGPELERVVDAFLSLRIREGASALPALLKNYHLSPRQRADLIRSYNNYLVEPPPSLEPLLKYAAELARARGGKHSPDSKEAKESAALAPAKQAVLEVLGQNPAQVGTAAAQAAAAPFVLAMLEEPEAAVRLAAIQAAVDLRLAQAGPRLLDMLLHGSGQGAERQALIRALARLREKAAAKAFHHMLLDGKSKEGEQPDIAPAAFQALGEVDATLARKLAAEQPKLVSQWTRGMVLECWTAGPFAPDMESGQPPEKNPDPAAVYDSAIAAAKVSWKETKAEPHGLVTLNSASAKAKSSVYVLAYVHSGARQQVTLQVGAGRALRVWLNGQTVFDKALHGPAWPDMERTPITLQAGWNTLLARVGGDEGDPGLFLTLAGGKNVRLGLRKDD